MVLSPKVYGPGSPIPREHAPPADRPRPPHPEGQARAPSPPVVTVAVIVANLAVMGLMLAQGVSPFAPETDAVMAYGANSGLYTLGGQWWRLLTSCFVHGGLIHLAFNMYVLWDLGRLTERVYGSLGFALVYLAAGIGGSLASALVDPMRVSVGASGAVFGVAGAFLAFLLRNHGRIHTHVAGALRRSLVTFVLMNLAIGFAVPFIDQSAHIGGLVTGFLAGLVASPTVTRDGPVRAYWAYPIVAAAGAGACALAALGLLLPR